MGWIRIRNWIQIRNSKHSKLVFTFLILTLNTPHLKSGMWLWLTTNSNLNCYSSSAGSLNTILCRIPAKFDKDSYDGGQFAANEDVSITLWFALLLI